LAQRELRGRTIPRQVTLGVGWFGAQRRHKAAAGEHAQQIHTKKKESVASNQQEETLKTS